MKFPDEHPFNIFNGNFYLESGTHSMPIYIFKFGNLGAMIQLHFYDKINGPHGRLYEMHFQNEYYFDVTGKCKDIEAEKEDDVLKKLAFMMGEMRDGKSIF